MPRPVPPADDRGGTEPFGWAAHRARHVRAGNRLVVAGVVGLVAFAVAMALTPWEAAVLAGWNATSATFVAWVFAVTWGKDGAATAALATRQDDSRAAADLVLVSASVASLVAVGFGLVEAADAHGVGEAAMTTTAVLAVVLAWAAVQSVFTLRYARLYYGGEGGIDFPDDSEPDYRDFAYLAFTIGMTYQVSDTGLTTKPVRRTVTGHALLSYLFGTVVVATTINVVAGLLR